MDLDRYIDEIEEDEEEGVDATTWPCTLCNRFSGHTKDRCPNRPLSRKITIITPTGALMAAIVLSLASGCAPLWVDNPRAYGPQPQDFPLNQQTGQPIQPADYAAPGTPPPLPRTSGLGSQMARDLELADRKEEQDAQDAKEQADVDRRQKLIAGARADKLCKATDSDDKCRIAGTLRETLQEACQQVADLHGWQGNINEQWRSAHKYGIIDTDELATAKSMAEGKEDDLKLSEELIFDMRGKKFNPKRDCKSDSKSNG